MDSKEKLSSEELNNIMMHSIVLSNLLIEKFEIMEEHGLPAHRVKQSVKNANIHLNNYIDKVFSAKVSEKDKNLGADIVLFKQNKIENVLIDKEVLIFEDKKGMIKDILTKHGIFDAIADKILIDVEKSEVLNF